MNVSKECPLAPMLRQQFSEELNYIVGTYDVGPSVALCNFICPAVVGRSQTLPDGTCAVRARLLREAYFTFRPLHRDPWSRLSTRLDALDNGTAKTKQLLATVKEIVKRYVFLVAYIAANRENKDFPNLLAETVEGEECWPSNTDPDVLSLYEEMFWEEREEARSRLEKKGTA